MNVPKLRFKEFNDEWKSFTLGDLTELSDGTHFTPNYKSSGIPFWSVETITKNAPVKYISEEEYEEINKRCNPQRNDILITRISSGINSLGVPKLVEWDTPFSIYVSVGLIKSSNLFDSSFLVEYINTSIYKKEFLSKSLLTASPKKINMNNLATTLVKLPSLQEQKKLGEFFSLLEKKIQLQQEKIDLLKEQKKGYIQKIFSRELRFKDDTGKGFPQWTITFLKDIVSKKFKGSNADYIEDPSQGNLLLHNEFLELGINPLYVNKENDVSNKNILILWDGSQAGNIYFNREGVLGSTFIALELIPKINSNFIGQQLQYLEPIIKKSWREGSGVPHVSKSFIDRFKIKICCEEEQQKISDFLNMHDKKIRIEECILLELDKQKQAFMQQMFI